MLEFYNPLFAMKLSPRLPFRNSIFDAPEANADQAGFGNRGEMPRLSTGFRVLALMTALMVFLQGPAALLASEFNIDAGVNQEISSVVLGGPIIKSGLGTLILSGANTFASGTLNAGVLKVGSTGALGAGSLTINGGSLDFASALTVSNQTIWVADFGFVGTSNGTLSSGSVSLVNDVTVTVGSNVLTVRGTITEGGLSKNLTKAGLGTLALGGSLLYTGTTFVTAGTLNVTGHFANSGTLNVAAGAVTNVSNADLLSTVLNSGNLNFLATGGSSTIGSISGNGITAFSGTADVTTINGGSVLFTGATTNTVTTLSGGSLTLFSAGSTSLTLLTGGVVQNGGTLSLSGFGGGIVMNSGSLRVTILSAGSLSNTGIATLGEMSGGTASSSGTLVITRSLNGGSLTNTGALSIGTLTSGVLYVNGGTVTVSSGTFVGLLSGSAAVNVNGLVILGGTLGGYSGALTNNGGSLRVDGLLAGGNNLTVTAGSAVFTSAGFLTTAGSFGVVSNSGALSFISNSGTVSIGFMSGSGVSSFGGNFQTTTLSDGTITVAGTAYVTTLNGGSLTLSGLNNSLGSVSGGSLTIGSPAVGATVGTFTSGYVVNSGALSVATGTFVGTMVGGGSFTSSGDLNLGGTLSGYSGTLTTNSGTLIVSSGLAGNNSVIVAGGSAVFSLAGGSFNSVTNSTGLAFSANSGTVSITALVGNGVTSFAKDVLLGGGISTGTVSVAGNATLGGSLSGGALSISGSGVSSLAGVTGGSLTIGGAATTVNVGALIGGVIANNGVLNARSSIFTGTLSGTGTLVSSGSLVIDNAATLTNFMGSFLVGSGSSLSFGMMTLGGSLALNGGSVILSNSLILRPNSIITSNVGGSISGGSLMLDAAGLSLAVSSGSILSIDSLVAGGTLSKSGLGTLVLSASNVYSNLEVNAGSLSLTAGSVTMAGGLSLNGGALSSSGALSMSTFLSVGSGSLVLSGSASLTSPMLSMGSGSTVTVGTVSALNNVSLLNVGTSAGSGAKLVLASGTTTFGGGTNSQTLNGSGTIDLTGGATLALGSNLILAPGNSPGTLGIVGGSVTVSGTATPTLEFEYTATSAVAAGNGANDYLRISVGSLLVGSTSTLNVSAIAYNSRTASGSFISAGSVGQSRVNDTAAHKFAIIENVVATDANFSVTSYIAMNSLGDYYATAPARTATITATPSVSGGSLYLTIQRTAFATIGSTQNAAAVGRLLDKSLTLNSGGISTLIDKLDTTALDSSGISLGTSTGILSTSLSYAAINSTLQALNPAGYAELANLGFGRLLDIQLGLVNHLRALAYPSFGAENDGEMYAWTTGYGGWSTRNGESSYGSAGYTSRNSGDISGVEKRFGQLTLGLTGAVGSTSATLGSGMGSVTTDTWHGGLYGSMPVEARGFKVFLDAAFAFGSGETMFRRDVNVPGVAGGGSTSAKGSNSEWLLQFGAAVPLRTADESLTVTPSLHLVLAGFNQSALSEGSLNGLGALMSKQTATSTAVRTGVQAAKLMKIARRDTRLTASVDWIHSFDSDRRDVDIALTGSTGGATKFQSSRAGGDAVRLGVGGEIAFTQGIRLRINLDEQLQSSQSSTNGSVSFGVQF